jgi:hypothetical protein
MGNATELTIVPSRAPNGGELFTIVISMLAPDTSNRLPPWLACGKRLLIYTHVPMKSIPQIAQTRKDIQIACPFMRAAWNPGFGLVIPLAYGTSWPDFEYMTHEAGVVVPPYDRCPSGKRGRRVLIQLGASCLHRLPEKREVMSDIGHHAREVAD